MAFYPEIQRKAQEEVVSLVGLARLPSSEHRQSLPYVEAIILETLRWKPIVPANTPHVVVQDDEYGGYFIPKDTVVIAVRTLHLNYRKYDLLNRRFSL